MDDSGLAVVPALFFFSFLGYEYMALRGRMDVTCDDTTHAYADTCVGGPGWEATPHPPIKKAHWYGMWHDYEL